MVYRFIDKNKEQFGLRWLCRHFKISLNCYYNYLKDTKRDYYEQRFMVYERIKYIYYNNNRTIGYRPMKIFLQRYGIYLSTTTIHKYMNKDLNLSAIVMRKKPGYKSCKKHKIFDNLLKQKFNVDEKNKIWCTDFTYMRQPNGKFRYNCTIMDLFDRSAIASVNSDYINTELAIETLTEALKKDGGGPAAYLHQFDQKDSPYYVHPDFYRMKSHGSLLLLSHYRTHQQETEYTCGPAAALTVADYYLGKSPHSEMEIARIMETHPWGMEDVGTNTRGMVRYFTGMGWTVHSSLTDGSPETYEAFVAFVKQNLSQGIPIMVENVDWGGHWRVIIGFDSLGDDKGANDVLIMADPYDTTDHLQDGYGIVPSQRFYYTWFDAKLFRPGEADRQWLTAVPPQKLKKGTH